MSSHRRKICSKRRRFSVPNGHPGVARRRLLFLQFVQQSLGIVSIGEGPVGLQRTFEQVDGVLGMSAALGQDFGEIVCRIGAERSALNGGAEGFFRVIELVQLVKHPTVGRKGIACLIRFLILASVVFGVLQCPLLLVVAALLDQRQGEIIGGGEGVRLQQDSLLTVALGSLIVLLEPGDQTA